MRRYRRGRVRATANQIIQKGGKALGLACDVTKREQVDAMIQRAIEEFGSVEFQFNSAGAAGRRSTFLDIDDELWDQTFDLNAKSVYHSMQAVLPHMLDNGGGVIVNVASMSHKRGAPGSSIHYAAAKGAVVTMTLGVAREFAAAAFVVSRSRQGRFAPRFRRRRIRLPS